MGRLMGGGIPSVTVRYIGRLATIRVMDEIWSGGNASASALSLIALPSQGGGTRSHRLRLGRLAGANAARRKSIARRKAASAFAKSPRFLCTWTSWINESARSGGRGPASFP
jgi:hypothetical protein